MKRDIKDHFRNGILSNIEWSDTKSDREKYKLLLQNFDKNMEDKNFIEYCEKCYNSWKLRIDYIYNFFKRY